MPSFKQPFVGVNRKYLGALPSSTATIPNHGITKITAAATYTLAGPEVGSQVTIFTTAVDAVIVSVSTVAGSTGQVSFDANGGTAQKLNLLYDSTVLNMPMVTLLGVASTKWRIMNFGGPAVSMVSSNAGITVTT
jgi:hypothetical protein